MPKYAEEILAAVTELQQHPTAEQVFLEMKREHPSITLDPVYLPCLPEGVSHDESIFTRPFQVAQKAEDEDR